MGQSIKAMNLYAILFYTLGSIVLIATGLAITRRNVMHAIVYLVVSFFGMAPIFYLLGAPFLALLEIIIYAGAIMVLFIFVVMTLNIPSTMTITAAWLRQWAPALGLSTISGVIMIILFGHSRPIQSMLPLAMISPNDFGYFVFDRYWLPVEIASFLLFVALVGAYYLGRRQDETETEDQP